MILQGEIRNLAAGRRGRVLVVSSDITNEFGYPIVANILRGYDDSPPFLIALTDQDSVAGMVHVNGLYALPSEWLGGPAGMVSGATWAKVKAALHDLLDGE